VIEEVLGLGPDTAVLVGIAVGYEDEGQKINHIVGERDDYKKHVSFFED
jgi:hypothetical protein